MMPLSSQLCMSEGYKLIVTVDCGTMAHAVLAAGAQARGQDVIVADHHQTGGGLPDCYALINPRRADDDKRLGAFGGGRRSRFMLVVGLNRCCASRVIFEHAHDEPKC